MVEINEQKIRRRLRKAEEQIKELEEEAVFFRAVVVIAIACFSVHSALMVWLLMR